MHMTKHPAADRLVLEEFRLSDGAAYSDADGALAARDPTGVPLLTSIADDRDVASVRCVPARSAPEDDNIDHAAFGALVSHWGTLRTYRPRIAESSLLPPASYRLAVTESGVNDSDPVGAPTPRDEEAIAEPTSLVQLLWIGVPRSSHAGLLVVIGDGEGTAGADVSWPVALSRSLGVRIYRARARA